MAEITEVPPPKKSPMRELVETVLLALVIALVIRWQFIETYRVEGASMEATMHTNERVLVNKFIYRYIRKPKQGDVIVFKYPRDTSRDFIKRVIAVAGDRVEMREGRVYVNGKLMPEAPSARLNQEDWTVPEVPPDSVYVLGDNRDNSDDSRSFGQVPLEFIRGQAFFRIWPPTRTCRFINPTQKSGGFLACP